MGIVTSWGDESAPADQNALAIALIEAIARKDDKASSEARDEALDNRLDALEAGIAPYSSRAAAQAASVQPWVSSISYIGSHGDVLQFVEDADAATPALTTADGRKWVPAGFVTLDHYGTVIGSDEINAAIRFQHQRGGGYVDVWPGLYTVDEPIISRSGVIVRAAQGSVTFKLAAGADCDISATYNFDALLAAEAFTTDDHPDMAYDYGFEGIIFNGNRVQQSTEYLLFGVKMYGRRLVFRDCIIADVAGVNLWTVCKGGNSGTYSADQTKTPGEIHNVELLRGLDENWVYQGPSDTTIGTIVTNECGDDDNDGSSPQVSRFFPGEPVHSVVVDQNTAMQANYLNLNGTKFGRAFRSRGNNRVIIDTLIAAGGWGLVSIASGTTGKIKHCFAQANNKFWGGVAHPFVENFANRFAFGMVTVRRASGQDIGATGCVDNGGATWENVQSQQNDTQGGHLFIANAAGIRAVIEGASLGGIGSDGDASSVIITDTGCSNPDIRVAFNSAPVVWRNKKGLLRGSMSFVGALRAGQSFGFGVVASPGVSKQMLSKMVAEFNDGSADKANSFNGVASFDPTIANGQTVTFTHGLWRAPLIEEITLSTRVSGWTTQPEEPVAYVTGFDATTVTVRVKCRVAAVGASVTGQVICKIN